MQGELRRHSRARTPVAKISKQIKRTIGALRQQAFQLGIGLGHQRERRRAVTTRLGNCLLLSRRRSPTVLLSALTGMLKSNGRAVGSGC